MFTALLWVQLNYFCKYPIQASKDALVLPWLDGLRASSSLSPSLSILIAVSQKPEMAFVKHLALLSWALHFPSAKAATGERPSSLTKLALQHSAITATPSPTSVALSSECLGLL